jgi:hypothetical protein
MHRVDICGATGRELVLTAAHDGRLIADAVGEWLEKTLARGVVLTGPAGGRFGVLDAETPTYDAVDFCRALSGRRQLGAVRPDLVPF